MIKTELDWMIEIEEKIVADLNASNLNKYPSRNRIEESLRKFSFKKNIKKLSYRDKKNYFGGLTKKLPDNLEIASIYEEDAGKYSLAGYSLKDFSNNFFPLGVWLDREDKKMLERIPNILYLFPTIKTYSKRKGNLFYLEDRTFKNTRAHKKLIKEEAIEGCPFIPKEFVKTVAFDNLDGEYDCFDSLRDYTKFFPNINAYEIKGNESILFYSIDFKNSNNILNVSKKSVSF